MDKDWHPGFHDPSLLGWSVTIAYFFLAALSLRLLLRKTTAEDRPIWILLTAFFLLLAINKQLDLQSWLSATGRHYTRTHDLYENKENIRLTFMAGLVLGVLTICLFLRKQIRYFLSHHTVISIGLLLLGLYIIIRGLRLEKLGQLELLPFEWQWTIEALGIALILPFLLTKPKITS